MKGVWARRERAQSVANNTITPVIFDVVKYDTKSEYNATTGIFTVKSPGFYRITAQLLYTHVAWPTGSHIDSHIVRNGVSQWKTLNIFSQGISQFFQVGTTALGKFNAGDTIVVNTLQNQGGAVNLWFDGDYNYLLIEQLEQ